ncbi:MAG: YwiC-like family protein [Kineosporiaceae bacterium]
MSPPPPARRRAPGWIPNQHGAWAMLASPLLVGALAAGPAWVHLPLGVFWFVGYFAFFATGLWLKASRRPRHRPPVIAYGAAAAVLGVIVVVVEPRLVRWVPAFAVPLAVGLWSSARRTDRSLLSGLSTSVGSALMTLVAYDAGGGTDWRRAGLLAATQAAYFAGTVFYVKSLIRERGDEAFRRLSIGCHLAFVAAAAAAVMVSASRSAEHGHLGISWWVVAVFALLAARAAWVPRLTPPPRPARIGLGEIAATLAVAVASLAA